MADGITEILRPKLDKINPARAEELMNKFLTFYSYSKLKVGDAIMYVATENHRLSFWINNNEFLASIEHEPDLIRAFFALDTDDPPATADARWHFVDRVPLLWNRKAEQDHSYLELLEVSETVRSVSLTC